jgi:hypothetical protein
VAVSGSVPRRHWGCGSSPKPNWIKSDRRSGNVVDVIADIHDGLPLDDYTID